MIPLPVVFTLWYVWVHIGSANCSNKTPNVEMSVNNLLDILSTLGIPDVDLDDGHIRFQRDLDDVCYDLKPLELGKRTTLVLNNTRELDRELFYKLVYLI